MTTHEVHEVAVRRRILRTSANRTPVAGNSLTNSTNLSTYRTSSNDDYDEEEDYYYSARRGPNMVIQRNTGTPPVRISYGVTPGRPLRPAQPVTALSVSRPSAERMRALRLNQFEPKYNADKEAFKIKEEARKRKKLEEKLKRYKGVGELGNKMSAINLTEEEKHFELWQSRNMCDAQYRNHVQQDQLKREAEEKRKRELDRERELEKLSVEENSTDTSGGLRLGGTPVNRVKGDHPLLKQLQK